MDSVASAASQKPEWLWGVTLDSVSRLPTVLDALRGLSQRPTVRVVFDPGVDPSTYVAPVAAIHDVAAVMGELLDSFAFNRLDETEYLARATQYMDALGDSVDIWEVGNEVNGDWLGPASEVAAKVAAAHRLMKSRKRRTALTLFYSDPAERPDIDMFAWEASYLPGDVREQLDYVLISYYERAGQAPADWSSIVDRLAERFPSARIGVGECGTEDPDWKEELLAQMYSLRLPNTRFVGGFFWWYFSTDMVPRTQPLWHLLDAAMSAPVGAH